MLKRFRNMTKWGIIIVIAAFVITIFADWGANITGWSRNPSAFEVNGDDIDFDQVDRLESSRTENKGDLSDTERKAILKGVIDDLIREKLSLDAAKRIGFVATEREIVNQTRDRLFRDDSGKLDAERFKRARREVPSAEWAQYEKVIGNDISLWKIFNFVTGGITITPDEYRDYFNIRFQRARLRHILIRPGDFVALEKAKEFYDANPDSFTIAERVKGRHILFALPKGAKEEDKLNQRSLAEAALIKLQSGLSFDKLYEEALKDTSGRVIPQELDWFFRGQMVPEFDTVAFNWPTKTPTRIIETQFGYHIAYFDAHEQKHLESFDEVKDGIRARLAGEKEIEKAKAFIEELAKRIKNGESFEAVASQYSSGKSKKFGGLVGDVIPGEMTVDLYPDTKVIELVGLEMGTLGSNNRIFVDPEINRVIFDLDEGAVSDIVSSAHGFHIVKLEQRKPADPKVWITQQETVEKEYSEILRNQMYADWFQKSKSKANISYSNYIKKRLE